MRRTEYTVWDEYAGGGLMLFINDWDHPREIWWEYVYYWGA